MDRADGLRGKGRQLWGGPKAEGKPIAIKKKKIYQLSVRSHTRPRPPRQQLFPTPPPPRQQLLPTPPPLPSIQRRGGHQYHLYRGPGFGATALHMDDSLPRWMCWTLDLVTY
ncbi:unnamed protein product [Gadus morhua 'NCC']